MNLKLFKPLIPLIGITAFLFISHKIIFWLLNVNDTAFRVSLILLYCYFILFSLVNSSIIIVVSKKNFDLVGFAYLIVSSIKLGISYLIFRIFIKGTSELAAEKTNFLVLFLLFLATEAVFTVRILNKKNVS